MICPKCSYEWEPRKPNPKVCPRCKGRLDWHLPMTTEEEMEKLAERIKDKHRKGGE